MVSQLVSCPIVSGPIEPWPSDHPLPEPQPPHQPADDNDEARASGRGSGRITQRPILKSQALCVRDNPMNDSAIRRYKYEAFNSFSYAELCEQVKALRYIDGVNAKQYRDAREIAFGFGEGQRPTQARQRLMAEVYAQHKVASAQLARQQEWSA